MTELQTLPLVYYKMLIEFHRKYVMKVKENRKGG